MRSQKCQSDFEQLRVVASGFSSYAKYGTTRAELVCTETELVTVTEQTFSSVESVLLRARRDRSGFSLEPDCDGTVVYEFHLHVGAEFSCLHHES